MTFSITVRIAASDYGILCTHNCYAGIARQGQGAKHHCHHNCCQLFSPADNKRGALWISENRREVKEKAWRAIRFVWRIKKILWKTNSRIC